MGLDLIVNNLFKSKQLSCHQNMEANRQSLADRGQAIFNSRQSKHFMSTKEFKFNKNAGLANYLLKRTQIFGTHVDT
jgi:hypothetical protein